FRIFRSEWPSRAQGAVGVCDAKDPALERDLLADQSVRIARTVPPLVVPSDHELDGAPCTEFCSFLFADNGMPPKVETLFCGEDPRGSNVLAFHSQFADIAEIRGLLQHFDVVRHEMNSSSDRGTE